MNDDCDTRGIFPNARCIVTACKQNHGDEGTSCGYMGNVSPPSPCLHPKHKAEWAERQGEEEARS